MRKPLAPSRASLATGAAGRIALLVAVNALVGGLVGQERAVLPLIAQRDFHLQAATGVLSFLVAFGLAKAATNLAAGAAADRFGRRPVLVAGWVVGVPVPVLLMWAPAWGWVIVANALLGVNQGLTWSMTVAMKIDLASPRRRGLVTGLNEASGYGAVALSAAATGFIAQRTGLRPQPFFLGLAIAALGLGLSAAFVRETAGPDHERNRRSLREVVPLVSHRDRTLSACAQAGLVTNLNDGVAWGLFPILFAAGGLSLATIGALAALYPAVWGLGQLATGTASDRIGRKPMIVAGMLVQGSALAAVAAANGAALWAAAMAVLGLGTAMVYPTLLAAVSDASAPAWRASALGVYRAWRDGGTAIGAIAAAIAADALGTRTAIALVAAITAASGLVVVARMGRPAPASRSAQPAELAPPTPEDPPRGGPPGTRAA